MILNFDMLILKVEFLFKKKSNNRDMEVCVDSLESVVAAYEGGADRIELCSSLNEGGLTPSIGLLKRVKAYLNSLENRRSFGVHCMLRCRVGDFCYSDYEIETMLEDMKQFLEVGVDGLVFGALTPEVSFL